MTYTALQVGQAIKLTADIIVDNVRSYGNQNDFIGHVGGMTL